MSVKHKFTHIPQGEMGPIKLSVPPEPYYLNLLRHTLGKILSDLYVSDQTKNSLVLSLDEACTNLIKYRKIENIDKMEVAFSVEENKFIIEIYDFCDLNNAEKIKPPIREKLTVGGLGIRFIKQCVDQMELIKNNHKMMDLRLIKIL